MKNTVQKIHGIDDMEVANAISKCFISTNVVDYNLEPANVVDALALISDGLFEVAAAIKGLNKSAEQPEQVSDQNEAEEAGDSSITE